MVNRSETPKSEWQTRFVEFTVEFSHQPDHVAAILSTSRMDDLLKRLIESRLLPCPSKEDELLESERGIGTFSNRIDMAFRLVSVRKFVSPTKRLARTRG